MKKNRFVFDTNALLSAFLLKSKSNALAFDKALEIGEIISSEAINKEFTNVFLRKKFDQYASLSKRLALVELLETQLLMWPSELIKPLYACRDPKDNMYLELAVVAYASCIITGDKDLLALDPFEEIRILPATDFIALF
jgi:putative PIN family toxin of toxin-antitoxin system